MKKTKKLFSVILAITILFSSATSFLSAVKAEPNVDYPEELTRPMTMFEHNADYLLYFYAMNAVGYDVEIFRSDVPNVPLVPINWYITRNQIETEISGNDLQDGDIDAKDSSFLHGLSKAHREIIDEQATGADIPDDLNGVTYHSLAEVNEMWYNNINSVKWSLVDYLKSHGRTISDEDVTLRVDVTMPAIQATVNNTLKVYNAQKIEYSISSTTGITAQLYETIKQVFAINRQIEVDGENYLLPRTPAAQEIITLTATTSAGEEYKMVLGKDNNWYLLATTQKVIINYVTNGGNPIDSLVFNITNVEQYNTTVTLVDATKEGSKFIGWYINEGLTDEANIKKVIDVFNLQNISTDPNVYEVNVYAKWSETTDNPKTGLTNTLYISGATIIASIGLIAIAKKKNLFKKI